MREAVEETLGAFDPTLLPALVDAGYETSMVDPTRTTLLCPTASPAARSRDIGVDGTEVRMPVGLTVDSGGIGKGYAADRLCSLARARGASGGMVEIAGDLAVGARRRKTAAGRSASKTRTTRRGTSRRVRLESGGGRDLREPASALVDQARCRAPPPHRPQHARAARATDIHSVSVIAGTGGTRRGAGQSRVRPPGRRLPRVAADPQRRRADRHRTTAASVTTQLGGLPMNDPHIWWYVTRTSAMLAWTLMTLSVMWGVLLSTRILRKVDDAGRLQDLHRYLGGVSLIMLALHMVSLMLDGWLHFSAARSCWCPAAVHRTDPLGVAIGILAFYVLIAVYGSSLLRDRLPPRFWKGLHYANYVAVIARRVPCRALGHRCWELVVRRLSVALLALTAVAVRAPAGHGRDGQRGSGSRPAVEPRARRSCRPGRSAAAEWPAVARPARRGALAQRGFTRRPCSSAFLATAELRHRRSSRRKPRQAHDWSSRPHSKPPSGCAGSVLPLGGRRGAALASGRAPDARVPER